jgi:thiol reductant ABC exporter CydC subunit
VIAVFRLLRPSRALLAVVLGALVVLAGAGLLAASGALITGAAQRPETLLVLMPLITAVRFFGFARAALRYAERLVSHDVSLRLVAALRVRLLAVLLPLSPAVLSGDRSGEVLARVRADVDELQHVFTRLVAPAVVAVLAGGTAVGLVALVDGPTAVLLAVTLLILGVAVPAWARHRGRDAAVQRSAADAAHGADTLDLLTGLDDILTGDGGVTVGRALDADADRLVAAERRLAGIAATTTFLREAVPGLGLVAALWWVGREVHAGATGPLLLAATALGVLGAFEAVGGLGVAWSAASGLQAAADRVGELGRRRPAVVDPPMPRPRPARSVLAFEGVTVRHPDAVGPAVTGFDLRLEPGDKVALTGRSGSGKSSLLLAALRARDPLDGRITLGGVDLRELRLTDVRGACAWSAQVPQIVGGTLAGNLRLADPDLSEPDLENALLQVGLDPLLATVGLHGWIGEAGERLSAGERARVGLARALLSPAPILLIDEPTAHLDTALAARTVDLLAADPRTVLMVTHSPALCDGRWRIRSLD